MAGQEIFKSISVRWYLIKIWIKYVFYPNQKKEFKKIEKLEKNLSNKKSIVVLCSGPSAIKLKPNKKDFYLVTNDSYKMVKDFSFLYYVNDGYFFRRFLANAPLCKNHVETLLFYRKEDHLHENSFRYFKTNLKLIKNKNYLISNFESNIDSAYPNYTKFIDFLYSYHIPIKIQNSGIFLLLFGFYLAEKYDKELCVYGLDLGVGGKVHFEKGGHVGKSITSDRVKVNTKSQLDLMYKIMKSRIKNYSNFNPNS